MGIELGGLLIHGLEVVGAISAFDLLVVAVLVQRRGLLDRTVPTAVREPQVLREAREIVSLSHIKVP